MFHRLASPITHPSQAHDPKATSTLDFALRSLAKRSFSCVLMAPLKKHASMLLSGSASTSLYLMSIATGQKTMSALATTSRIFSFMSRTAISQPPQLAAQYKAIFTFSIFLPASWRTVKFEEYLGAIFLNLSLAVSERKNDVAIRVFASNMS